MSPAPRALDLDAHRERLLALFGELDALEEWTPRNLDALLRRHPKNGTGFYSRSDLIAGFRAFGEQSPLDLDAAAFAARLRRKPVRTHSGVTPVTVLTRPFPCPGRCIFCPNDPTMPKSYIASEPGCQRAESHAFDPYRQTFERLRAFHANGHPVEKVEILVLGGTWSHYPESYQIWFVKRCFDALNAWGAAPLPAACDEPTLGFEDLRVAPGRSYNATVSERLRRRDDSGERADFAALAAVQRANETAEARCVGLVLETRPDCIDRDEVRRLRRLGATKIQMGVQSLDDDVLARNRRGHDVDASRRAATLLRGAGFKLHLHWMPNLLGATADGDAADFLRLFRDPAFRPDELKLYPCSLIEGTELVAHHRAGRWRPYEEGELTDLLVHALDRVPEYCRLTRVIRDIPSQEILVGNRRTNFREVAERALAERGGRSLEIRQREIGRTVVDAQGCSLRRSEYGSGVGREVFLQMVSPEDRIAAFARLTLPRVEPVLPELAGCALLREVHVYGPSLGIGRRADRHPQHAGFGRRLIEAACSRAAEAGFETLAVISAVGTRPYYRQQGFEDGELYQHRRLAQAVQR